MPTVIDKATGDVIEEFSYDEAGEQAANDMVNANPNLGISNDAMYRSNTTWDDGNQEQNTSDNMPDPYGSYDPMSNLVKK